jgi:pectate lyase
MYNNYFKNITDYGVAVRMGGHALIQNNYYEGVNIPITTNKFTGEGYACESGNIFTGCGANSITQTGCDWWNNSTLPYNYTLDAAADLGTLLPPNVGVGKVDVGGPSSRIMTRNTASDVVVHPNYPNPSKGITTFRIYTPENLHAVITLYDLSGRKIALIAERMLLKGDNLVPYNTGSLAAGMYRYQVATSSGSIVKTLVIQ